MRKREALDVGAALRNDAEDRRTHSLRAEAENAEVARALERTRRDADDARRARALDDAAVAARATQGCFNVTSTRVFSDRLYQKKHSPYENLRRDDHRGDPNHMSL